MPKIFQLERDRAYDRLIDMILHGDIGYDTVLSERKLADSLGMGRTPVREALRNLEREGVIDVRVSRGMCLKRLSVDDLREIYETRQALEGMAAFLAARHGPTDTLLAFEQRLQELGSCPDTVDSAAVDDVGAEFHLEIIKAARNDTLLTTFQPLRLRFLIAFGLPRNHDATETLKSVSEHLAILGAIRSGESDLAEQLMRAHLGRGLTVRTRLFDRLEENYAGAASPVEGYAK